ncbi:MAG: penicillin acylase family protein [Chitinophagaceae bacterium]|nr:penicillin acylase family protein [Chitinophagaceae bacterium]
MRRLYIIICTLIPAMVWGQRVAPLEAQTWKQQADRVTIVRDSYGIPHIYGNTDADAVFGLLYAQCEDDFPRVEMNYIEKLGQLSEVYGESKIYDDLLTRLVIDSAAAVRDYESAPEWLKKLCNAFADGINYYLFTHPEVKPKLIQRFQPWYPMLWTDGSIGAVSTANFGARDLRQFYTGDNINTALAVAHEEEVTGSNGFAFAPRITASGHAILYINPHVTFYFRPEVHVVSNEGLNAYGAVTWGQFFVYQGFNEFCGWMHTSSYADVSDAYLEDVTTVNGRHFYLYDGERLPVNEKQFTIRYRTPEGVREKHFTGYFTGHGPVMGTRNSRWVTVKSDNRNIRGLIQSWKRTKAGSFQEYKEIMGLLANASNNTVYADAAGNIAYWHGNFIPRRDPTIDWSQPVDGTTSKTDWKGLHPVDETVHIYNPENGWIENCNSTPFTAAGPFSPKREDYPAYMAPDEQNFRGLNAVRILPTEQQYTLDKVIGKGYDTYLMAFESLIPAVVKAYNGLPDGDSLKSGLKEPVKMLSQWNFHSSVNSVATTLAIYWGEKIMPRVYRTKVREGEENSTVNKTLAFASTADASQLLPPLLATVRELEMKFGSWKMPWGEVNRFQRISGDIENHFDDNKSSIPVGFASSAWGMLPSYSSRAFPGTLKRYGVNGNSFVCAVEFGQKVKAKSLLAGGESGNPASPHFFDQGEMYAQGQFKEVWFYKEDVMTHAQEQYNPGERKR